MTISQKEIESLKKFIGENSLSAKICTGGFRNFTGSVSLPDALVIDIETISALRIILAQVHADNQKKSNERTVLRVAAGGRSDITHSESWSMSPCCAADIIIRLTGNEFCQLEVLDNNMVRAGASLQIGETDRRLYNDHGLTLSTSPLLEGATLAGFMCNGGHGNGKEQPAFSGLVHAISLCLPNGEMRRIDSTHPDFETIRGAPLGLFGIITELEIATIPAKKMERTDKKRSIPELYEEIRTGQLFEKNDYISILFIPNTKQDEATITNKKNVLINCWNPVSTEVNNVNYHPQIDNFIESIAVDAERILHVNQLEEKIPSATPTISKFTAALTVGDEDHVSVAPWYDSVHYLKEFPTELEETGWIFETDSNGERIIEAFEYLIQKLDEYAKRGLYPISHGIYARYFRGTNGGLSMSAHSNNSHVCGFDMASGKNLPGYTDFLQDMQAFLVGKLHAKPHWGKFVPQDIDYSALYGKEFEKFQQALHDWYHENELELEKSMLLNNFHARILGMLPANKIEEKKSFAFFSTEKIIENPKQIDVSKQDTTQTSRWNYSTGCQLQ